MTHRQAPPRPLGMPERSDLPYFAYGLFKPGELAHGQVKPLLHGVPEEAWVSGALYIRDGLPLLKLGGMDYVQGYLMRFRDPEEAYAKISAFEPKKHYKWSTDEVRVRDTGELVNVLLGRSPERASVHDEEGEWTGRRDPVLTTGLTVVGEVADRLAREEFVPYSFDWRRLFQLQMAYLFLWTVVERYAALSYGPTLEPMDKVRMLGEDPAFVRALEQVVTREDRVYDSRNPRNRADLNPKRASSSADYYYYVRSNLSHRGKGAWKDGEIVRKSLLELYDAVHLIMKERIGLKVEVPTP